ncbi:MAG: putative permease [Polaribacter sp.]|jgi:predicted permease
MNSFIQELKLAQVSLSKRLGFVTTVVLTLGLTLGALVTVFNLNYLILMKPLPYPEQQRLMAIDHDINNADDVAAPANNRILPATIYGYQQHLKNQHSSFEKMSILKINREFLVSHNEQPNLTVLYSTPEYFSMLQTKMALGRYFSSEEGFNKSAAVAVITFATWQKWFKGESSIIGKIIQLGDKSFNIIGVSGENFVQPEIFGDKHEVWLPWDFNINSNQELTNWGNSKNDIAVLAKLKKQVSITKAQSNMSSILNDELHRAFVTTNNANQQPSNFRATLIPLKTRLLGDGRGRALLLMAAVIALLLIACSNVINLFYSRAAEKQRNFAIQAALGARKSHLFKAMFAETFLLTFFSGVIGLLIAAWGFELLKQLGEGQLSRLDELGLDFTTILFSIFTTIILAVIFAFFSSRLVNYSALKEELQSSGKGGGLQISKFSRDILIVSQITLATLLLVGSFTVLQKAYSVIIHPLGYNPSNVISFRLDARSGLISKNAVQERNLKIAAIQNRLLQLPQVDDITASFGTPIGMSMSMVFNDSLNKNLGLIPVNFVSDNYFSLLQVPMIQGRMFTAAEVRDNSPVLVVSRSAAAMLVKNASVSVKNRSVIGMKLLNGGTTIKEVIGVVEDSFDPTKSKDDQGLDAFIPYNPWNMHFLLKLKDNAELNKASLLKQLHEVDANLRVSNFNTLDQRHQNALHHNRLNAGVAAGLTILALLLAGIGMYGVLSYSSQMRRYELGVRMALGARTQEIIRLVIKDNMLPISIGIGLSLGLTLVIYFFAKESISSFNKLPILPLLITLPILVITALFASYIPVRKMLLQDPVKALRNE